MNLLDTEILKVREKMISRSSIGDSAIVNRTKKAKMT